MHTIIETPEFIRCAKVLKMSDEERKELIDSLSKHPTAGDEIMGTGGARKVRFARSGAGKSGSYRVRFTLVNSYRHLYCLFLPKIKKLT